VKLLAEPRKITKNELAQNNGRDGKPAYVAFKGTVYDVSASAFWMDGDHMGAHQAGKDLTEEMELAPHREETLQRMKNVGVLI
jgi:predicted heme/steroid binding protein